MRSRSHAEIQVILPASRAGRTGPTGAIETEGAFPIAPTRKRAETGKRPLDSVPGIIPVGL
jgi:hypothetical protein